MKRTVVTCDKCATESEHASLTLTVPASLGAKLGERLGRAAPVAALDFCKACADELVRLIGEPHLTLLGLEVERDDAHGAAQRCLARVRDLEGQLTALRPDNPPTEPPMGMPDPLLEAGPTTEAPPALPSGFALPPMAFPFTTEPPAKVPPDEPAAASPLAFAHGGGQ